jgi:hypothetical protein
MYSPKASNPSQSLTIKTVTWARDSHGLYDYESHHIEKKQLQVSTPCIISRSGTEISQTPSPSSPRTPEENPLCSIDVSEGDFSISSLNDPIWLVVRTMRSKYGPGYILREGSQLKLGRVALSVAMLRSGDEESESLTQESEDMEVDIPNERETASVCRICLTTEEEDGNPMISPCKCDGSMKYVHLLCLRKWLQARMGVRETEHAFCYFWKAVDCEICKTSLPFTLGGTGKTELIKFDRPKTPFLVLQGNGEGKNEFKGVYIISVKGENSVTIGRGQDADVRISDISVSRCHSTIRFVDGHFVIEDNNSKFGTLLKYNEKILLKQANSVVVQMGRTVFSFSTKVQQGSIDNEIA